MNPSVQRMIVLLAENQPLAMRLPVFFSGHKAIPTNDECRIELALRCRCSCRSRRGSRLGRAGGRALLAGHQGPKDLPPGFGRATDGMADAAQDRLTGAAPERRVHR